MDPVWHARRRRKGARNGSRHASAAGPPFFMICYCIGHHFGTILTPFWHLFSEKKGKNDARMVPKKDVSSKWANKEATKGQKERKEGKGKKSKSGNQGVSEGGKEAKKGKEGKEGNAGKPFDHAASSTEPKAQSSEGRKGNKTNQRKKRKETKQTKKRKEGNERQENYIKQRKTKRK